LLESSIEDDKEGDSLFQLKNNSQLVTSQDIIDIK